MLAYTVHLELGLLRKCGPAHLAHVWFRLRVQFSVARQVRRRAKRASAAVDITHVRPGRRVRRGHMPTQVVRSREAAAAALLAASERARARVRSKVAHQPRALLVGLAARPTPELLRRCTTSLSSRGCFAVAAQIHRITSPRIVIRRDARCGVYGFVVAAGFRVERGRCTEPASVASWRR